MNDDFYNRLKQAPTYATECADEISRVLNLKGVQILITPANSTRLEPLTNRTTSLIEYEEGAGFVILDTEHKREIAEFVLCQLRGCCGVCMSTGERVAPEFRGKGVGTILGKFRRAIARDRGYTVLFCTHVNSNQAQNKVLQRNGWLDVYRFRNRRTGNLVDFSIVPLGSEYEAYPLTKGENTCLTIESPRWKFASSSRRTSWFSWLFTPL